MAKQHRAVHICFFTGKRGGFTHLIPIMQALSKDRGFTHSVIAADMHLSRKFGYTLNEVKRWAGRVYQARTLAEGDTKAARSKSIGRAVIKLTELLAKIRPDLVFILGDRGEVLAAAIAAMELNIPTVHLFGGDLTQGGVDEPVRHAITKLACIHLASNRDSAKRIRMMGEESWRVHNVGSPVLDLIRKKQFTRPAEVARKFNLRLDRPILILLQHSVTWQVSDAEQQMSETMAALDVLGHQTVAIYPCSDPGYTCIIRELLKYRKKPYLRIHKNLDFQDFWGLLNVGSAFLGNSSAGMMESATFRIPVINIGIRQEGRLHAGNVIHVPHDRTRIKRAVERALKDSRFKAKVRRCRSPYGDGTAAQKIVRVLKKADLGPRLLQKKLVW